MEINNQTFLNILFAKASAGGVPLAGSFELTSRCNLDCKMCYIHRRSFDREALLGEKNTDWWVSLAKKAKDAGMLMLLLTGGEPLLRTDFDDIYKASKEMGLLVSVNTNGVLLTEDKIRLFKSLPPQRINVSLYGMSAETYGDLCGNPDVFKNVVNSIKQLKTEGINVSVNYTVTPKNVHDAAKLQAFTAENEIPVRATFHMFPPVRSTGDTLRLSPLQAATAQYEWHKRRLGEKKLKEYASALFSGKTQEEDPECGEKINCRAGLSTFWVTWNGELRPCGMMNTPTEKMIDAEDFDAAWQKIRRAREEIFFPPKCKNCELKPFCDVCVAVCAAETGDFSGLPEYACEKARAYKEMLLDNS